jgi:hypothetical protein
MTTRYMNPYLAGFLLGLLLLATIFVTGRGLGASGAFRDVAVAAVGALAPEHASSSPFYARATGAGGHPLKDWLVFEVAGVILGALGSGVVSKRLTFEIEHPPHAAARTRLVGALAGGVLFGIGSQFGRGCTSGAALSGMAVLSAGGMLTMAAIFGSAYLVAYFFRRLWT